tara:strand:+ start:111 stop:305 length:195 start_codon:yes stop_codon:yes gene_type:complete
MKTFLLITTVMFTTPEKDFSGVIVQEFEHLVTCKVALEKHQDISMNFGGVMSIDVKHKCEEKND